MKAVNITIRTRQMLDGETLEFKQESPGMLEESDHGFLLHYQEKDESGMTTDTSLLLCGTHASLKRTGAVKSEMRFQENTSYSFPYHTPYGTFSLTLATSYLRHTMTERGGKVMIRYTLSAQEQLMGEYTLKLHITEKDD